METGGETQNWKRRNTNHPTHRFIKLPPVLFMDSSCAQNMFASPVIRSVSLKLGSPSLRVLFTPCASCSSLRVLCEQNHTASEAKRCTASTAISPTCVICFFLSQLPCSMPSMLVGAPFESSSMLRTYPRTTKPSKQRRKRTQKPIPHSSLLWTSFSEPPLRCGHRCRRCGNRCRRCGFLHSPVRLKYLLMLFDLLVGLYCFP